MSKQVVGSDGMKVVCRAGPPQEELPPSNNRFEIIERSTWFPRRYQCGHKSARWFRLHTYGEDTIKIRQQELCPECCLAHFKQHIIRCALCGLPIMPGAAVALYRADPEILMMDIATVVRDSVVGCLRTNCCPSGGFFCGHWSEQGYQPAFTSGTSLQGEAMATGEAIVVNI